MDFSNMDFGKMMESMQKMQSEVLQAQNELAQKKVEGYAANKAVQVVCSGTFEFSNVKIDPNFFASTDVETLEDTILVAIQDACSKVMTLGQQAMNSKLGNMLPPMGS